MDSGTMIVWGATLGSLISLAAVVLPFLHRDQRSSRLKLINDQRKALGDKQLDNLSRVSTIRQGMNKQSPLLSLSKSLISRLGLEEKFSADALKSQLSQAGFRGRAAMAIYMFFHVVLAVAGGAIALFVVSVYDISYAMPVKAGIVVLSVVIGFYLPKIALKNIAQGRQQAMNTAFPDAMDLLVICVESGLGIESAFDKVTEEIAESAPILAQEFGLTTAELAYLGDRSKAYENFAIRTGLPAAKSLATTLTQSEKYGTPVGVALKVLSQERRDERMSKAEKKGAALPAKLTVPMIIFFLPVLFVVVLGPSCIQIFAMK